MVLQRIRWVKQKEEIATKKGKKKIDN
jgi:hypothetical protein